MAPPGMSGIGNKFVRYESLSPSDTSIRREEIKYMRGTHGLMLKCACLLAKRSGGRDAGNDAAARQQAAKVTREACGLLGIHLGM